jgi:hypothetical protein
MEHEDEQQSGDFAKRIASSCFSNLIFNCVRYLLEEHHSRRRLFSKRTFQEKKMNAKDMR